MLPSHHRILALVSLAGLLATLVLVPPALGMETSDSAGTSAPAADADSGLMDVTQAPAEAAEDAVTVDEDPAASERGRDDDVGLMEFPGGGPPGGPPTPAEPASGPVASGSPEPSPQGGQEPTDAELVDDLAQELAGLEGSSDPMATERLDQLLQDIRKLQHALAERALSWPDPDLEAVDRLRDLRALRQRAQAAKAQMQPAQAPAAPPAAIPPLSLEEQVERIGRQLRTWERHPERRSTADWDQLLADLGQLGQTAAKDASTWPPTESDGMAMLKRLSSYARRAQAARAKVAPMVVGQEPDAAAGLLSGASRDRLLEKALLDWTPKPSAPTAQGPVTTPPQGVDLDGLGVGDVEAFPLQPPSSEVLVPAAAIGLTGIAGYALVQSLTAAPCAFGGPLLYIACWVSPVP